jgi:hypothetical protein
LLDHFATNAPATGTRGAGFSVRVSAADASGNVATGSRGEGQLTNTAGTSGLPSDFTFSSNNDNGDILGHVIVDALPKS